MNIAYELKTDIIFDINSTSTREKTLKKLNTT